MASLLTAVRDLGRLREIVAVLTKHGFGEVLTRWAIGGEGLAWRSAWEVSEEVKRGRLLTVLDDFAFPGNNIYAVYPERRLLPAKVKFFIEFLRKTFGDPPYWE